MATTQAQLDRADLSQDERWQLVLRIVSSKTFAGSRALQAFLLHVTEQTLLGHSGELKEHSIGAAVLRRNPDYDPASDNIVRVRAGQLRLKLDQYFRSDGLQEEIVVSIPKGGYVPHFEPRSREPEPTFSAPARNIPQPRPIVRAVRWPHWTAIAALSVLCAVLAWHSRPPYQPGEAPLNPQARQFWRQIFPNPGSDVLVVLSDSTFALWQDLTGQSVTLADYVGGKYLDYYKNPIDEKAMREVGSRRYTSLADADIATRLPHVAGEFGDRIRIRFARHIDVHDIGSGNVILLGSRRANPWVELFERHLRYTFGYDNGVHRPFFRNGAPRNGEPEILMRGDDPARDSYAVIALLPNLERSGKVLIIEGLTMEGTDAAGELLLNPASCALLDREIVSRFGSASKPFEALLRLTPVAGGRRIRA